MITLLVVILVFFFIGFILFILLNKYLFRKQVLSEIKNLTLLFSEKMNLTSAPIELDQLPAPVQRYLDYCNATESEEATFLQMKHKGSFRTDPGQKWMPIVGEEYFTVNRPGFIWFAKLKPAPFFWIQARDRYVKGEGRMTIKLWSTFTMADPKGDELDVSALIRFLLEMPLFPKAFLSATYIIWESIDNSTARAYIQDGELKASGIFHFNDRDELIFAETNDRYREQNGKFIKQKWTARYDNYQEMNGIRIPTETIVAWDDGEEFQYARFIITDVKYD